MHVAKRQDVGTRSVYMTGIPTACHTNSGLRYMIYVRMNESLT